MCSVQGWIASGISSLKLRTERERPLPLTPPVGPDNVVLAHDDLAILPQSLLIRHISPDHHVVLDENRNVRRISSAAFAATSGDPDYGMSVDVNQLLAEQALPAGHVVPQGMGAVSLIVADLRGKGLRVGSDPTPTNEFHGQVWGVKQATRKAVHRLVKGWVVPLSGVALL